MPAPNITANLNSRGILETFTWQGKHRDFQPPEMEYYIEPGKPKPCTLGDATVDVEFVVDSKGNVMPTGLEVPSYVTLSGSVLLLSGVEFAKEPSAPLTINEHTRVGEHTRLFNTRIDGDTVIGAGVILGHEVIIGRQNNIGAGTRFGPGSATQRLVNVGANCYIGDGAKLELGVTLYDGAHIGPEVSIDMYTVIEENAYIRNAQ